MRKIALALIMVAVMGMAGCQSKPRLTMEERQQIWIAKEAERTAARQEEAAQSRVEALQHMTEGELNRVENGIRSRLTHPASARFSKWVIIIAENERIKHGTVVVEATNNLGTQRTFRLWRWQLNPDGTVLAEPYVRGM